MTLKEDMNLDVFQPDGLTRPCSLSSWMDGWMMGSMEEVIRSFGEAFLWLQRPLVAAHVQQAVPSLMWSPTDLLAHLHHICMRKKECQQTEESTPSVCGI